MRRSRAWSLTLWRSLGLLALALAIGIPLGMGWQALALAALLGWALQYRALARLLAAAGSRSRLPAPHGWGAWSELEARLQRRERDGRARRERLRTMVSAYRDAAAVLPDAAVVLDTRDQSILWSNAAATTLLGLVHPRDRGKRLANLVRAPRLQAWLDAGAHEPLPDLPSPVDPGLQLGLRRIPSGPGRALLVARDMTRMTRLEQVRRDFVANVSHELRTPLTVIHGYLEMMEPEEHPEWAPLVAEMRRQSRRMAQIVEDLLTLSRLEAVEAVEEEAVAMEPLLATLLREAQALSQGRHRLALEDSARMDLCGSASNLHSAFSNLVANAVRYTPADGAVTIRWRSEGASLVYEVEDSGPGIPAEHLPRLTERFYRVSSSRSRESGGTGLGLSIVKHVLHLHQARLEIDSTLGKGSIFRCRFDRGRALPREA